jgi:hypothetical protein
VIVIDGQVEYSAAFVRYSGRSQTMCFTQTRFRKIRPSEKKKPIAIESGLRQPKILGQE